MSHLSVNSKKTATTSLPPRHHSRTNFPSLKSLTYTSLRLKALARLWNILIELFLSSCLGGGGCVFHSHPPCIQAWGSTVRRHLVVQAMCGKVTLTSRPTNPPRSVLSTCSCNQIPRAARMRLPGAESRSPSRGPGSPSRGP